MIEVGPLQSSEITVVSGLATTRKRCSHQPANSSSVRKPAQNALVETPQILAFLTSTHGFRNEQFPNPVRPVASASEASAVGRWARHKDALKIQSDLRLRRMIVPTDLHLTNKESGGTQ